MLQSNSDSKTNFKSILLEFFNERKFHYETTDNDNLLVLPISGENGNWKMLFHINEESQILQIRSLCPINIKENQKLRIAELLTRLNKDLLLGCFILDFEEGEIAYKTAHLFKETDFSTNTLNILFGTNAQTFDEYLPAISAVNSGFTEPCLAAQ